MRRSQFTRAVCPQCGWTGTVNRAALADGVICPYCPGDLQQQRDWRHRTIRSAWAFLDGTEPIWLIVGILYGATFGQRAAIGLLLTAAVCLTIRQIRRRR